MLAAALASLIAAVASASVSSQDELDFAADVLPLLEARCFRCHGSKLQEAGLRLDRRSALLSGGDSGGVALPGDASHSLLIERITAQDRDVRMPPGGPALTTSQIDTLRRWIDEGAHFPAELETETHWAFVPPVRPPLPDAYESSLSPIDRFVRVRLAEHDLRPAPRADPWTLVRRVHLDLIGLPPSPEVAAAFVNDTRPDAYERLVDSLLNSVHYGERWARPWLDLARYADTHGYEKDRPRSIWPWRDWVIGALNADMPYDRFTTLQIAGDLVPGADEQSRVATGFHRNTMVNEEGGVDVEEFRYLSVVDRVDTTGAVWLGLTLSCARCHSHKYDPIRHREYWQLFSFLNQDDEVEIDVGDAAIDARRAAMLDEVAVLESALPDRFGAEGDIENQREERLAASFQSWQQEQRQKAVAWTPAAPQRMHAQQGADLKALPDGSILVYGDKPNRDTYELLFDASQPWQAIRLDAMAHESLPKGGPGRAPLFMTGDFLLSEIEVAMRDGGGDWVEQRISAAHHGHAADGRAAAQAIDGKLDTGWASGRAGQDSSAVFVLSDPIEPRPGRQIRLRLVHHYIHQTTLGRFRLFSSDHHGEYAEPRLSVDVERALINRGTRSDAEVELLRRAHLAHAPELADARADIDEIRRRIPARPTTLVLEDRGDRRRPTHVHQRGEYLQPGAEVEAGVPAVLHALSADASRDRFGLARWLVDPSNPLIGRVTVNRAWQSFFGTGIVPTAEDFGTRGEAPSHPELLDWLAVEFVAGGWSMKQLHRRIVLSETYRQSARGGADSWVKDPENRWLSRGPRFRLDAEPIRDQALTAAGLLSRRLGGPSVFPPQPGDVTTLSYGALKWNTSVGPDRWRRGLYTYAKRTAPYAATSLFDAPNGEITCTRRARTNTPLQALVLLNDTVFTEAAQGLARRIVRERPTEEARLLHAFRLVLVRPPDALELDTLQTFLDQQRTRLKAGELDAGTIAGSLDLEGTERSELAVPDDERDPIELAAWTLVARALLNLDETVTKE